MQRFDEHFSYAAQISGAEIKDICEKHHFKSVVNLRPASEGNFESEAETLRAAGIRYESFPVTFGDLSKDEVRAPLLNLLADVQTPALVHCASGKRAVYALLMFAKQCTMAELNPDPQVELAKLRENK
jgi:uncharacterized protein (TIGR01244 family)